MTKEYLPCKKCGSSQGMGLENRETGEIEPLDLCRLCLFPEHVHVSNINLHDLPEWKKMMGESSE